MPTDRPSNPALIDHISDVTQGDSEEAVFTVVSGDPVALPALRDLFGKLEWDLAQATINLADRGTDHPNRRFEALPLPW